jgi:hypothetical protein
MKLNRSIFACGLARFRTKQLASQSSFQRIASPIETLQNMRLYRIFCIYVDAAGDRPDRSPDKPAKPPPLGTCFRITRSCPSIFRFVRTLVPQVDEPW